MTATVEESRRPYGAGILVPVILTVLLLLLDAFEGPEPQFVGILAVMPMLSAVFVGPRATLFVGAFAILAGYLFGLLSGQADSTSQWFRLAAILLFTLAAVGAALLRERRAQTLVGTREVAEAASRAILRPLGPQVAGVNIAVSYTSAHELSDLGGDLYEAISTPHGLRVAVGDVRGKGLDAVRLATVTLGSFREAAHHEKDLAQVARRMDQSVGREAGEEDFVTGVLLEIANRHVRIVSCGHPEPLLIRRGIVTPLEVRPGTPWGMGGTFEAIPRLLLPGDRILLYTDGVTEARSSTDREVFFPLSLEATVLTTENFQEALPLLVERLQVFTGHRLQDDAALLLLEVP